VLSHVRLPELDKTELHFAPCQSGGSSPFRFVIQYSEHEIAPLFPIVVFCVGAGGGGVGGVGGTGGGVGGVGGTGGGGGGGGGVGLVTHLFLLHSKFGPIQSLSLLHVPVSDDGGESGDEGESEDEGSVSDDFLNTKKYSNKPIAIRPAKIPPAIHIFLVDIPVSGMPAGDATGETPEMPRGDTTGETPEDISSRIGSDTVAIRLVI
jgi:hypothetical protein